MFELDAVSVRFGRAEILKPLSTAIEGGEVTVIAGPNGAGKSTLLKLLARELRPSSGEVRLHRRALDTYRLDELAKCRAVLPQSSQLSFPFTVLEVTRLGLQSGSMAKAAATDLVLGMLRRVELDGYAHRYYHQLSGGERQRVHLARVLCQLESAGAARENQFLLLDEPISSLDLKHQIGVLKIARDYSLDGVGVLAVLHDLNLSALFASRLIVMSEGRVAADGPPSEVLTSRMIEDVFGVALQVNKTPNDQAPFILPHGAV